MSPDVRAVRCGDFTSTPTVDMMANGQALLMPMSLQNEEFWRVSRRWHIVALGFPHSNRSSEYFFLARVVPNRDSPHQTDPLPYSSSTMTLARNSFSREPKRFSLSGYWAWLPD